MCAGGTNIVLLQEVKGGTHARGWVGRGARGSESESREVASADGIRDHVGHAGNPHYVDVDVVERTQIHSVRQHGSNRC